MVNEALTTTQEERRVADRVYNHVDYVYRKVGGNLQLLKGIENLSLEKQLNRLYKVMASDEKMPSIVKRLRVTMLDYSEYKEDVLTIYPELEDKMNTLEWLVYGINKLTRLI